MAKLLSSLTGDGEIAALFAPDAEIEALLRFEVALAGAEARAGLISGEAAAAIANAVERLRPDMDALAVGLRRDGVVIPALVEQLRKAVGEPHGKAVHLGATSQDAIDTGLMLRLKGVLSILDERLAGVVAALDRVRAGQGGDVLMAHTRMQAALPFTVAAKLDTWAAPLVSHRTRLGVLGAGLAVQLGGPIGDGSSFEGKGAELRAGLAKRLGLADAPAWHTERARILDIAQGLALLTGTLGKIGQDVALLAQAGTVVLAGGGGSSAMAHKENPVGAEVLVTLGRWNAGLMGALQQSMIHENERSGAAWTLEWIALPQMAEAAGAALAHASAVSEGLRFN